MTSGVSSCLPPSSSRLSVVAATALHNPGPWASDPFSCFCCMFCWRLLGLQMQNHLHDFNQCSGTKSSHQAFPAASALTDWDTPLAQRVYFKENYGIWEIEYVVERKRIKENYGIWEIEYVVERKRNQDDSWFYGRGTVSDISIHWVPGERNEEECKAIIWTYEFWNS